MKPLDKNELYENLTGFLKTKGIELKEGSYAQAVQKSCSLLTDAINLGQDGLERAKSKLDSKVDQMRQVIHEKTAPRTPGAASTKADTRGKTSAPKSPPRKPRARKNKNSA
jgi:hypothetical protein